VNDGPVADAQIIFRKATDPTKFVSAYSDASGLVTVPLGSGVYEMEVFAPGYWTTSDLVTPAITVDTSAGVSSVFRLAPASGAGGMGWIDATVLNLDDRVVPGIVVIAVGEDVFGLGVRTVYGRTDNKGVSRIPNLTSGSYTLEAYGIGQGTHVISSVDVIAGQATFTTIRVGSNQLGSIHGTTNMGSADSGVRTITLREPRTGAAIGRQNFSPDQTEFVFYDVANGNYHLHVEDAAGSYVAAAHEQAMYGGLAIQVSSGANVSVDVPISEAVQLVQPINGVLTDLHPSLVWSTASEADFYVVEVKNAANEIVFGGFAEDGTARLEIPQGVTSIAYGALDYAAVDSEYIPAKYLAEGQRYRWRVYACVHDANEVRGYRALGVSPLLMGSFQAAGIP